MELWVRAVDCSLNSICPPHPPLPSTRQGAAAAGPTMSPRMRIHSNSTLGLGQGQGGIWVLLCIHITSQLLLRNKTPKAPRCKGAIMHRSS